jgi:dCTP diphosphatase
MTDLDKLQELVVGFREERDWKQFHNPKDTAISLLLEASEFLEHFQWKNETEVADHIREKKSAVSEELADVLYWVLLISHDLDISLDSALRAKIEQNRLKYPVEKAKGKHTKYTSL